MNELYPLRFQPIVKDKIWGGTKLKRILHKTTASEKCGESWEISSVQGNISVVKDGFLKGNNLEELIEVYMGDLVGDKVYEKYGLSFPLLIKFIDADKLAKERHNSFGKTEMWYIIESDANAELISGFSHKINKETCLNHLNAKTLKEILNYEKADKGDVFFMPAGRVHSIGAGILLAEIQQTSDVTYRIYDWDRLNEKGESRELHTDLAVDAIDYNAYGNAKTHYPKNMNASNLVIECNYFTTHYIPFNIPVKKDFFFIDSFVIYMCIKGNVKMEYRKNASVMIGRGETILVPAMIKNITLLPDPSAELLEIYIKGISKNQFCNESERKK